MKIKYINEGAFDSYKNIKLSKEDKLKNLRKQTIKIIINDIIKKLPDLLKEKIGSKEYIDSVFSKKSTASYNYNFSQMFLRIQDFLGVDAEGDTIYLQFVSKFITSSGYTSYGPTGYTINMYKLEYYHLYLMAEALCKDLYEEFSSAINFDFKFMLSDGLEDAECTYINIGNKNKIDKWSLETFSKFIKYPEFVLNHAEVFENQSADEVYFKLLQKTYNANNTSFNSITGTPTINIDGGISAITYDNNALHHIFNLCDTFSKITIYIDIDKDLDSVINYCETLSGYSFSELLNKVNSINMTVISKKPVSNTTFSNIIKDLANISDNHFYLSTRIKATNKRSLRLCNSVEEANEILIREETAFGKNVPYIEIGKYKGIIKSYDNNVNNMIKKTSRNGDTKFYYIHVILENY